MKGKLRYSRLQALFAFTLAVVAAIVGLVVAADMDPGVPTSTLTNIAGAFLTLGLGGLLYEVFLREAVMNETLEIVGLDQNIESTKLKHIVQATNVNYADLCEDTSSALVLLSNPVGGWIEKEWVHLLDAARERATSITICLPNPDGEAVPEIARRYGYDTGSLRELLRSARDTLESSWKGHRDSGAGLHSGSKINIKLYEGSAGYDLVTFDSSTAIFLPQSISRAAGDASIAFVFRSGSHQPASWITRQFERLRKLADYYADEVK